jgi:hypothetical protein
MEMRAGDGGVVAYRRQWRNGFLVKKVGVWRCGEQL